MTPARQLPLPGSPEARDQGCTCPEPAERQGAGRPPPIDRNCPLHGRPAGPDDRVAEPGPIDTEGDIVDAATDPELRRS